MFAAPLAVALGRDLRGGLRTADRAAMAIASFVRQEVAVLVGRALRGDGGGVAASEEDERESRKPDRSHIGVSHAHFSCASIAPFSVRCSTLFGFCHRRHRAQRTASAWRGAVQNTHAAVMSRVYASRELSIGASRVTSPPHVLQGTRDEDARAFHAASRRCSTSSSRGEQQ
jgi:hypothetical protein